MWTTVFNPVTIQTSGDKQGESKSIMKQTNVIHIIYIPFCFVLFVFSLTHEIYK